MIAALNRYSLLNERRTSHQKIVICPNSVTLARLAIQHRRVSRHSPLTIINDEYHHAYLPNSQWPLCRRPESVEDAQRALIWKEPSGFAMDAERLRAHVSAKSHFDGSLLLSLALYFRAQEQEGRGSGARPALSL